MDKLSKNANKNELLILFQEVFDFSKSVNDKIEDVHKVSSQVKKSLELPDETNQSMSYMKLGKVNSKLFMDIVNNAKETTDMLERVIGKNGPEEMDLEPLSKHLKDLDIYKQNNFERLKYFKTAMLGIKKVAVLVSNGVADKSTESLDTIHGFSDFLDNNPEVATSSPVGDW